jgi:prepilin-type processing-associated H-X9-DG protein
MTTPDKVGKYYKKTEWTDATNRALVTDAINWTLWISPTDAQGTISPQRMFDKDGATSTVSGPGGSTIDLYRHGKYPPMGTAPYFSIRGGALSYNILYVDGHAAASVNRADGYKAIRMRYP